MKTIVKHIVGMLLFITVCTSSYAQQLSIRCFFQGYLLDQYSEMIAVADTVNSNNVFDTVKVDFVNPFTGYISYSENIVASKQGWMNITLPLSLVNTDQYLAIKHRNCLRTWSAVPVHINAINSTYDFTLSSWQAFGSNEFVEPSGHGAVYSGDVNDDGRIDSVDLSIIYVDANNFLSGNYLTSDLNADLVVDLLDMVMVNNNTIQFMPEEQFPFSTTTQIQEIKNDKSEIIYFSSNPVNEKVVIQIKSLDIKFCSIYNQLGQLIYSNTSGGKELELNTSKYPSGLYVAKVIANTGLTLSSTFIIKH